MIGWIVLVLACGEEKLGPGDHTRSLTFGGVKRSYFIHVPKKVDAKKPAPVVLALHGAGMNGSMMPWFTGLNKKADEAGFIVVYPSGSPTGSLHFWNAGGLWGRMAGDDVGYIREVLDDLEKAARVDKSRIYACGLSNGAMMCYRLAAEMPERFAAVCPVAGTIALKKSEPKRPVPILHFHGTEDKLVSYKPKPGMVQMMGVEESVKTWVKLNGCKAEGKTETITKEGAELKATRTTWSGGKEGSEVVLVTIEGGGHTWPGQKPPVGFIGKSSKEVVANDLMWEFFKKHKRK